MINDGSVATHMLVFMIRGLFTSLEFVYAQFPTHGLTGESLFPIVWKAIRNIEECGLKVIVVTADGASTNRKFFTCQKLMKLCTKHPTLTVKMTGRCILCPMYPI